MCVKLRRLEEAEKWYRTVYDHAVARMGTCARLSLRTPSQAPRSVTTDDMLKFCTSRPFYPYYPAAPLVRFENVPEKFALPITPCASVYLPSPLPSPWHLYIHTYIHTYTHSFGVLNLQERAVLRRWRLPTPWLRCVGWWVSIAVVGLVSIHVGVVSRERITFYS